MPSLSAQRILRGKAHARDGFQIFIDFDNTITIGDVLDGIIEKFAVGERWRTLETEWEAGRIGARSCLDGQIKSLVATWPKLQKHLDGVRLDPGFRNLLGFARRENIELTILSDNFDLFLRYILERCGFGDVASLANHLECTDERLTPSFPFSNANCPDCAHCKKTHFVPRKDLRHVVYIGDGRSDLCPARHADIVYAKASLLAQLQTEGHECIPFTELADVTQSLKTIIYEYSS